jgi:methyl-accepting chemotaxis protein
MDKLLTAMRRMTIRSRMIGTIFVVLALVCAVGATGMLTMASQRQAADQFIAHSMKLANLLKDVNRHIGDVNRLEKDMVINYESAITVNQIKERWQASVAATKKTLAEVVSVATEREKPLATEAAARLDAYVADTKRVIGQVEDGAYDNARTADKMLARAKGHMAGVEDGVQKLSAALDEDAAAARAQREAAGRNALILNIAVLCVVGLIVVPFTLMNMQSICKPLDTARELAASIASGDLSHHVTVEGRDETAAMMHALGTMQESLQRMVGLVRQSTDSIGTASAEIATGNLDLSHRTEQAAANLQQAAASMEQLTGTVKQSADSARQANQLATSAADVAARGRHVVSQVVSTMDEINASSKKISDIIGVIDGIAFQTNILALNAAVEAARAGEQGRGFAVVAGEVRNLAQRSAEAAKEIKGLIGASVDKVESGSRLVADAGSTMQDIVSSVQRVTDIIGEITAASTEQSDGIGQINTSVTQLDKMTQQNAALVEESAAAAESLKEQASRLTELVGQFKLDDTHVEHEAIA